MVVREIATEDRVNDRLRGEVAQCAAFAILDLKAQYVEEPREPVTGCKSSSALSSARSLVNTDVVRAHALLNNIASCHIHMVALC